MNSTGQRVLKGRELVTCSWSRRAMSAFSSRAHRCASLVVSTACLAICFTRGPVALMDASYSCWDWLTGFTRPRPPMSIGNAKRSRSIPATWCSKRAGIRTSEMERSNNNNFNIIVIVFIIILDHPSLYPRIGGSGVWLEELLKHFGYIWWKCSMREGWQRF